MLFWILILIGFLGVLSFKFIDILTDEIDLQEDT